MSGILNIATTAAITAGKAVIQGFNQLDRIDVYEKSAFNFVSNIDHKSEQIIISAIEKAFPSHGFISEEFGYKQGDEYTWIIDPLDGTNNFIHGYPHFAISIAIQYHNQLEHGVIYNPISNELFFASKGRGAHLNNQRIRVNKTNKLEKAILSTGCPSHNPEVIDDFLGTFKNMMIKSVGVRRTGSAALDLAYVASGRLDGFWQAELKPWDIAAGALIVQEAGGITVDFNREDKFLTSGQIIATNFKLIDQILNNIQ